MARQQKWTRRISSLLLGYLLLITVLPISVDAHTAAAGVPQATVPNVTVPSVNLPQPPAIPEGNVTEVKQPGSPAATDNSFAAKTKAPLPDETALDPLHMYLDLQGLLAQGKNVKKSYDAYKTIKEAGKLQETLRAAGGAASAAAPSVNGSAGTAVGKQSGGAFPVLGGAAGIIAGSFDIMDSLSHNEQSSSTAQTAKFYSGAGGVLSGIGSVTGGLAAAAAGTAAAPALALAGTVLLAAGLLLAAAAVGMKYSARFRNSWIGRGLSGFKNWLGSQI